MMTKLHHGLKKNKNGKIDKPLHDYPADFQSYGSKPINGEIMSGIAPWNTGTT